MHVVALAGHVDHGKSTLVRLLTGMKLDRLAEERRRSLTIDLGFAWTTLPSGQTVAFVDVPGHERFVGNMLAGVGPVSAVLFVVAADEGWMPQSAEHLDALNALGVAHGVLAVTRSDLADPEPVRLAALDEIEATSLGSSPPGGIESVTVSGATGANVDSLRDALDRLVGGLAPADPQAPVRLWVDRAFTIRGAGTVVTGTLPAGRVSGGDELDATPGGHRVRVRGLESLKRAEHAVTGAARVAANLRGVRPRALARGSALLTPGAWLLTESLDVRLHALREPVNRLPSQLVLHVGSAAVPARARPLGRDTVRLTVDRALPLRTGDAALLREPAQHRIVAGVTVLDVRPRRLRRRGAAAQLGRELEELGGVPDGAALLRLHRQLGRGELAAMGCQVPQAPSVGRWLFAPDYWEELTRRLASTVAAYAARNPIDPRMPLEAARRAVDVPDIRVVEALAAQRDEITSRDGRVYPDGSPAGLPAETRRALDVLGRELSAAPFAAPDSERLRELGLTRRTLAAAVRVGALERIADGVFLLPGAPERAAATLATLPPRFTVSQARQALGTSRRVAVPLLELLDQRGVTRRVDEAHRVLVDRDGT